MAKMYKVSPPENAGELLTLEHLEVHLPEPYVVLGGVTIPDPFVTSIPKPVLCPHCGAENRLGAKHCRNCGRTLAT